MVGVVGFSLSKPLIADATTSDSINFQARLEEPSGAIVNDGDYNVQFKLYNASSGGSALWTETYLNSASQGVRVVNGYLTVNLGSITAFPSNMSWDQSLYITMNIGGTSTGSPTWDGEMTPRLKLTAVPYAFQAKSATQLQANNGANVATLSFTPPTANRTIALPDDSGTVCLESSSACGFAFATGSNNYIQNSTTLQSAANFFIQSTATGSATAVLEALSSQTAPLLQLLASDGTTVLGGFNTSGQLFYQSGSYTGTLVQDTLAQNTTYHLPDPGAGTATICLDTGNCAGTGGGITGSGTNNYVARFNSSSTIAASSLLYDNGTFVGVNTTTNSGQLSVVSTNASQAGIFVQAAASATTPALVVKGGATPGSGGTLLDFQDSTGALLAQVAADGTILTGSDLVAGSNATPSGTVGRLTVVGAGGSAVGAVVRAGSSQTGDLFQLQDSSGLINAAFDATGGQLTLGRIASTGVVTQGKLVLADGTTDNYGLTLQSGTLTANSTITFPNSGGNDTVCLLTLANCVGSGGGITGAGTQNYIAKFDTLGGNHLGNAALYDNGSFVGLNTTTNNGLLSIVGASASQSSLFVQGASSATTPVALIKGGATPGSGGDLLDLAINAGTVVASFDATGNFTTSGLITGTGGLSITGGTDINTTGTSNTFIGNSGGSFSIASTGLNVTIGGAVSGVSTLTASGAITAASSGNTINGLIVSSGALSGITGYTQTSGNFDITGSGTFSTGTGAISLNGATSVTGTNTLTVGTGAVTFGSLGLGLVQSDATGLLSSGAVDRNSSSYFTNALTVSNGGTGVSTLTGNGILFGNGTGAIQATASANNSVLITGPTGTPSLSQTLPTAVQGNITSTGALASGSIASGFGSIATANNITTSATLQGATINATTGYQVGGAAPAGHYLRGDGTNYVDSALQASDLSGTLFTLAGSSGTNQAISSGDTLSILAGSSGNLTTVASSTDTVTVDIVSNPTFSGLITGSSNTTGLALTGTPAASATSSLIQIGSAIAGGNNVVDGGTYIGLNAPATGAGSAADLLNFEVNGASKVLITNTGALTVADTLTVSSGGIAVTGNSSITGTLSGLTGLTSSGTITFTGLSTAGIVHNSAAGVLSTGLVALGSDTSGNYVDSIGTLTGLTMGGTNGVAGAVPTLSVDYGSAANTAVQGNTTLTCASGTGNLTGGGNVITLGSGGSCGNLTTVNNPTFSGLITANGGLSVANGQQLTNAGSTLNTAIAISDLSTGGAIGTAAATVDAATSFTINQTTAGQALTLPAPTSTTAGRLVYVSNIGTTSFTMYGATIPVGQGRTFLWDGSAWTLLDGVIAGTGLTQSGNVINSAAATSVVNDTNIQGSISSNVLTLAWAGQLSVARGGTGTNSFTANGIIYGNGSGALQVTNAAANSILVTDGSNNPSLSQTLPTAVQGNITSTGALSAGSIASGFGTISTGSNITTSATVQGGIVNATTGFEIGGAATTGHYLRGDGTNYVDSALLAGDISGTLFTLAGSTGTNQAIVAGDTLSILAGGSGNLTSVASNTDTLTVDIVSNPTFSGEVTSTANTTGLALTGAPTAGTGTTSLLQLGSAIAGGNSSANGGTYIGVNAPATGAGSAADFLNFEANSTSKFRVDALGALTLSGAISAPTSGNSINGLIVNGGALSGVTGYTQSSGNFAQSGSGTFSTGTGNVSLNGNTSVTGSGTFTSGTGAVTLNGATSVSGTNTFTVGTGATNLGGTLDVAGLTTLATGATITTGGLTVSAGGANITGATTVAGSLSVTGSNTFTTGTGTVTLGSLGLGIVQSDASGVLSSGTVDRNSSTLLSGTLSVVNGGTGAATLTANGILYGNGTSAIQATAAAASSILATNGSSVPGLTQTLPTAVQGNITSTGALASGSIASGFGTISTGNNITTSATLQGGIVNATTGFEIGGAATTGHYLRGDGTNYVDSALLAGDISGTIFTLAGSTGTNQTISSGDTLSILAGGSGNLTSVASNTDTLTVDIVSNPSFSGKVTSTANTTGLALTGTPNNNGASSLLQLGGAISGGNTAVNGGTYIGVNAPATGAGSAADFLNFEANGTSLFKVDALGALALSGAISAPTSGNTINGLIVNGGALSGITGYTQSSGNFSQTGSGTFGTGTGAVSLNGNTTVTGSGTFTSGTGAVILNGATSVSGANTFTVGTGATTLGGTLGVSGLTTLSGGATITGTTSINTTGTANTTIGNSTGTFSLASSGLNVSTAGALTGVTGITSSGGYTQSGSTANTFSGASSFTASGTGLSVTNDASILGTATVGTLSVTSNATVGGTVTVTGLGTFNGGLSVASGHQFTNASSTLFVATAISDKATGGAIGTAAATVDVSTNFDVSQTTSGQNLTLPSPTNTADGRIVYITNTGTAAFNMGSVTLTPGSSAAFIWNGSWFPLTSGSSASGVTTVGALNGQPKSVDGAVISGSTIFFQSADASFPGMVTTGAQTFGGDKTFANNVTFQGNVAISGTGTFTTGSGTVTLGSLGAGLVQASSAGVLSSGAVDRNSSTFFSNALSVANGGTGATSLTANGILYGNGTSAIQATAAAANSILATNGSNVPALTQTLPTAVQGNITSTGALTSGSIASGFGTISTGNNITTSATLQGGVVNATTGFEIGGAATTGHYLRGNGTNYVDSALLAGDISGTLFTLAGSTGTSQNVTAGSTVSILAGGSGNLTSVASNTDTLTVDIVGNPTFSGLITSTANTTGLALTGTPAALATSSLFQLGASIVSGNSSTNGGTYIGLNEPSTGAGSAADFLNFQVNNVSKVKLDNTGALTLAGSLTVQSGGVAVTGNSTIAGTLSGLTGLTSSGTITLSSLNAAGVVHTNASGVLSTGTVALGSETTGNYVASLGTLTGLSTTGNTGAGSTPTLSVIYGSSANTSAQGNTAINVNTTGNLTGGATGTAGGGLNITIDTVNNPTFSGLITGSANTTGLALIGTPAASATSSLFQLGASIISGNSSANGGTYIGLNAPASGAGSAADFLNFQVSGTSKLKVTNTGAITAAGALTVQSGGITVTAGGLTVAAGGLTITGNSTIAGTLSGLTGLTSSGTITLSGLGAGLVQSDASGVLSSGAVDRNSSTFFSNALSVANGGTGTNTLAANGILYGNGTSAIQATAAAANSVLITNGSNVPSLSQTLPTAVQGNITSTGALTSGSIASGFGTISTGNNITTSATVQGGVINATTGFEVGGAAATGHYLRGNGTNYVDSALLAGDISGTLFTLAGSTGTSQAVTAGSTVSILAGSSGNLTSVASNTNTLTVDIVSNPTFSGKITSTANTTGLALTGTPAASATSSLFQLGSAIAGGNSGTNGGTYIGLNEPATGVGSAADFLNFQVGGTSKVKLDNTGALTLAGSLTIQSGGIAVTGNSTIAGTLSGLTGITSGGTITFSNLNSAGVVHTNASGVLSTGSVALGSETTGNYVANLGTLTGLSTTGNTGAGSTPTLSVTYGSSANTSAQGNTAINVNTTGNLTGGATGTAGGGLNITIDTVNNPTFSGLITGSSNTTGLALIGTPAASATSSLFQLGAGIVGGNSSANGGTYIGLNEPSTGAGSAADFLNFQVNGTSKVRLTNAGALTLAGSLTVQSGGISVTGNSSIAGTLTGLTGLTSNGTITLSGLGAGLVQSDASGVLSSGAVDRNSSTFFSNALNVSNGGTGTNTLAANGILYGNGTSAIQATAAAANSVLVTNGSNVPSLSQTLPTAVQGNITSVGALVSGSIASGFGTISTGNNITTTAALQGATVNATTGFQVGGAATTGHYLRGNGTNYVDSALLASDLSGTLFTLAGSTGTSQNVTAGSTVSILAGSSGNLTSVASNTNTLTVDIVSNPTFSGLITSTNNTTGLALTGTPVAGTGATSLLQLGSAISGGNSSVNGGTYIGLNAPASGAGSAADFLNFQVGGTTKLKVDNAGAITASGNALIGSATNKAFIGDVGWSASGFSAGFASTAANATQTKYALLQKDDGSQTYLNAASGGTVGLRINNGTVLGVTVTAVTVNGSANFTTGTGTVTLSSLGAGLVQASSAGVLSSGAVDRNSATLLSNTLNVSNGGTGATTLAANGILYGNGTSAIQATAAAANSILATNGSNVPSLTQTLPTAVQGNITSTGALAAGSIASGFGTISTGNNISTTATLQGATVNATTGFQVGGAATTGHYLRGNGTNYVDSALLAGDISGTLFTLAGSTGTSQNVTAGSTVSILKGASNNLTSVASSTNTITVDIVSNPTFSGLITSSSNTTGLALTGAPVAGTGATSLLQLGGTISGGNSSTNGGTYLGINEPLSGTGSAADFLNFQVNGSSKVKIDNTGNMTLAGALTVQSGGIAITGNSTIAGTLGSLTGLNSSGTITFSGLSTGVVHANSSGVLSSGDVVLGSETSGNYVASLGTLTGLSTTGNTGEGSTPTLSVTYGSSANTSAQGNTAINVNTTGNLTGGGNGTAGGGLNLTINTVNNPTFSGLITGSNNTTGLALTGTPAATGTSSLLQLGGAIANGNNTTNGGTYIGINAPSTGAGSAADFVNFQLNGVNKLTVTNAGAITAAGQLTVSSGGITVSAGGLTVTGNSTIAGTLGSLTGLTSSGTITFSGLGAGVVQANSSGVLSSGTLTVANGGTGATSFTANGILYGNGTSAIQATAAAANSVLATNGSNVPSLTQTLPAAVQSNITSVGAVTSGSIGSGFGAISTGNNISTSAALQGATLSVASGAFTVNGTGAISAATGITSSGTITFSGLSSVGVVHNNASGVLSTSAVVNGDLQAGTFSNITGTGALSAGSIASGFGTISTGNNISTTATLQGATVNATTGFQVGGAATTGHYLRGNGTNYVDSALLAGDISGTLFTLAGSTGTSQNVTAGSTVSILAGSSGNITSVASATNTITVDIVNNPTFSGKLTASSSTTGIALTGTPTANGTSALLQLAGAIVGGNNTANGGTYIGINEPGTGAGSVADFLNFQNNDISKFKVTSSGAVTQAGQLTVSSGGASITGNVSISGTTTLSSLGAGVVQSNGSGVLSSSAIDRNSATLLTNTLNVSNGGTGATTLAANGILYGNGTSAIQATSAAANSILATNGSSVPGLTQQLPTAVQDNITRTGALAVGSIANGFGAITTGNNISTTATIQGSVVNATTGFQVNGGATGGHYLRGNGTNFVDSALLAGDISGTLFTLAGSTGTSQAVTTGGTISILSGSANITSFASATNTVTIDIVSNPSFGGQISSSGNTTGLALTGTPAASATSSLLQLGSAIAAGNSSVNGGTYIGLNEPASGPGSAADFLNFQANGVSKLKVTNSGLLNVATGFSVNGTNGAALDCSSGGQLLSSAIFSGGIITSGTCTTLGSLVSLQTAYNGSGNTNPQILLSSTNGGIKIQDGATAVTGNLLQIASNGGSTVYFGVSASAVTIADALNITGAYTQSGSGSNTFTGQTSFTSGGTALLAGSSGQFQIDGSGNITSSGTILLNSASAGNKLAITSTPASATNSSLIQLGSIISSGAAGGTFIGVNAGNTSTADFIDFQKNNTKEFTVSSGGDVMLNGSLTVNNSSSASPALSVSGVVQASTGFAISGATTAGHYLRNNGTNYVDSAIQSTDITGTLFTLAGSTGTSQAVSGGATVSILKGSSNNLTSVASATNTITLDIVSNPSFSGLITGQSNTTGLALTGTPAASATSSLLQLGAGIASGNNVANGGTYIGLNAPNTGAGSAADFLNFQYNGSSKVKIDNTGALTLSGAITAPTSTNTINNLVINNGALSNVTGYTQTSGTFTQSYSTGTSNSANSITATNSNTSATAATVNGVNVNLIGTSNTSGGTPNTLNGINLSNVTTQTGNTFTGINIGTGYNNLITSANFNVTAAGAVTAVGVNSGTGLLQGAAGLTITGAGVNLNVSSNFGTNINTGTSTGGVNIGNSAAGAIAIQSGSTIGLTAGTTFAVSSTNFGVTTGGVVTIGAVGSADSATYLCRNSSGQIATCSTTSTGSAFVQGGNSFSAAAVLGTNDANVLNFRTSGTNRLQLDTSGNLSFLQDSNLDVNSGGATPTLGLGTGTARVINLGNTNASTIANFTAGSYSLKIADGGVSLTSATSSGADLTLGDSTNVVGRTIKTAQAAVGNGASLTIQAGSGAAAGNTTGGNLLLQGGAKGATGTTAGSVIVKANGTDGNVFQVQNASGASILVVDSANRQLKVMENAGSTNYALVYYDTATSTANYTASTGTVAVGTGAGAISIVSGSSAAITVTANAASTWKTTAGSLTIQSGTSSDLILNPGSSIVSINGSSVVKLGSSAGDPATCTLGAIVYNSTSNLFRGCQGSTPAWVTLSSTAQTLQGVYTASTGGTTPEIKVDSTRGGVDIQDADTTIGGILFAVRGSNAGGLGTSLLNVNSSNSTVNIGTAAATTALLVLGSDTNSTFNAGTSTNAATVVNGAMFYSSTDHNFMCGTAGAWITCNGLLYSNTAIPAAVNTCTTACGNLGSASIPGNYCQAGRVIHIYARGVYSITGAPTLQMEVRYGTSATRTSDTLIGSASPTATTGVGAANYQWIVDYKIICFSTTSMNGQGVLYLQTGNASTSNQFSIYNMAATASTTGLTTTTTANLYLFPVWNTNSASNTVTTDQYIVTAN
jgi:hypothetical protein